MPAASCSDCGGRILLAAQPDTVFGSPDAIVERGVRKATRAVRSWVDELLEAIEDLDDPAAIKRAIDRAAKRFDRDAFAQAFGDASLHGGMLGALDADYEAEEDDLVAPARFGAYVSARYHPILLDTQPRFTHRGIDDAIASFERRSPVTRDVFDAMTDEARTQAFTVAGAASKRVVDTVKRELVRQVAKGAELRDFRKAVNERLESAGWTPRNPSHVETVFRTGAMSAYNGGRYQQQTQPQVLALRPLWQWISVADSRSRVTHKGAHRKVLRADDPWWRRAYPPSGFNCRCRVRSLRMRKGLTIVRGEDMPTPLPDPGWSGGGRRSFSVPSRPASSVAQQPSPPARIPPPRRPRNRPAPKRPAPGLAQQMESAKVRGAQQRLRGGINQTQLVELETADGKTIRAVYKPASGETGLGDTWEEGGFYKREAAAYDLDRALGGATVVPTTIAADLSGSGMGVGSFQEFASDAKTFLKSPLGTVAEAKTANRTTALDFISANCDRHLGNAMIRPDGRCIAIDNGLAFPLQFPEGFRSVPGADLVGLDSDILKRVRGLKLKDLNRILERRGIPKPARRAALVRARHLQQTGRLTRDVLEKVEDPDIAHTIELSFSAPGELIDSAELQTIDKLIK